MKVRTLAGHLAVLILGVGVFTTAVSPVEPRNPNPGYVVYPTPFGDLTDDYSRCLLAMDSGEIPASIGQCTPPSVDVSVPWVEGSRHEPH